MTVYTTHPRKSNSSLPRLILSTASGNYIIPVAGSVMAIVNRWVGGDYRAVDLVDVFVALLDEGGEAHEEGMRQYCIEIGEVHEAVK